MDSVRQKVYNMLCSRKSQATFEEFKFFSDVFKPLEKRDKEIIVKHTGRELWAGTVTKSATGGVCLGISLTFAVRRYVPLLRYKLSVSRILAEFIFVSGCMISTVYMFGVPTFVANLRDFRQELVLKSSLTVTSDDFQYLNFLKAKYRQFPDLYNREIQVFKDFMKEEDFVQWYSDHPQYSFEKLQSLKPEDFTSKKVYDDLMAVVDQWEYRKEGKTGKN